jgi:ActR/RegA family two-component response regulator
MTPSTHRAGALYDDVSSRPAITAIMKRCGFAVTLLHGPGSDLPTQVRKLSPPLLVLDLACAGSRGLGVIQDLRSAAPVCAVVLLAPFESLRRSALEGGAYDLTTSDDLRNLERCLRRLRAELDARDSAVPSSQRGLLRRGGPVTGV